MFQSPIRDSPTSHGLASTAPAIGILVSIAYPRFTDFAPRTQLRSQVNGWLFQSPIRDSPTSHPPTQPAYPRPPAFQSPIRDSPTSHWLSTTSQPTLRLVSIAYPRFTDFALIGADAELEHFEVSIAYPRFTDFALQPQSFGKLHYRVSIAYPRFTDFARGEHMVNVQFILSFNRLSAIHRLRTARRRQVCTDRIGFNRLSAIHRLRTALMLAKNFPTGWAQLLDKLLQHGLVTPLTADSFPP